MTLEGLNASHQVAAIHIAAFLLSDHQAGETKRCTCGDRLRPGLSSAEGIAAHQVTILEDAGLLVE